MVILSPSTPSGNVYVTGYTYSSDFPTTSGAYDTSLNGYDVFVSKLNGGLTSLLASTFLGGSYYDRGYSLALDPKRERICDGVYLFVRLSRRRAGRMIPLLIVYDVFVSKLNGGLTSLLASTFLGGSGTDYGYSLALDPSGNVYVTGYTYSSNFPTTSGAYDTSFNGDSDVFVSKLNSGLTSLLASTYLGGSSWDYGFLSPSTQAGTYM